jgi:hypothetical protein
MKKEYDIRISGEGTKDDIIKSLFIIIDNLKGYDHFLHNHGQAIWEDKHLLTQISEKI